MRRDLVLRYLDKMELPVNGTNGARYCAPQWKAETYRQRARRKSSIAAQALSVPVVIQLMRIGLGLVARVDMSLAAVRCVKNAIAVLRKSWVRNRKRLPKLSRLALA